MPGWSVASDGDHRDAALLTWQPTLLGTEQRLRGWLAPHGRRSLLELMRGLHADHGSAPGARNCSILNKCIDTRRRVRGLRSVVDILMRNPSVRRLKPAPAVVRRAKPPLPATRSGNFLHSETFRSGRPGAFALAVSSQGCAAIQPAGSTIPLIRAGRCDTRDP